MKATRRAAVTASGAAALGLAGCTADDRDPSSTAATSSTSTATETAAPDPGQVALERAAAITAALVAGLAGARPVIDPGGRLAAIHEAHLVTLQEAAGTTFTPLPGEPGEPGEPLTAARLRRRELSAQRELARLAQDARSGALARLFASMSAGIAAGLARTGVVPP